MLPSRGSIVLLESAAMPGWKYDVTGNGVDNDLVLRRYDRLVVAHRHDHAQLVLPLSGSLEMQIGADAGVVRIGTDS